MSLYYAPCFRNHEKTLANYIKGELMLDFNKTYYLNWNGRYHSQPCKIISVKERKNKLPLYTIELINKQESWLRSREGELETFTFSKITCHQLVDSKEKLDKRYERHIDKMENWGFVEHKFCATRKDEKI